MREGMTAKLASLDGQRAAALSTASQFWRDALDAARARPAHLRAVLYGAAKRAVDGLYRGSDAGAGSDGDDGGGCGSEEEGALTIANVVTDLDPASPLALMTPVGVVEAQVRCLRRLVSQHVFLPA